MTDDNTDMFPELSNFVLVESEAKIVVKRFLKESIINLQANGCSGHLFIESHHEDGGIDVPDCSMRVIEPSASGDTYEVEDIYIDWENIPAIIDTLKKVYDSATSEAIAEHELHKAKYKYEEMDIIKEVK